MPLEQSVLDWQVVGQRIGEDNRQMDVVVVAARRDMVAALMRALRGAGLKPVGIDVAAFGMIRALAREVGVPEDANAASYEQRVFGGEGVGEPVEVHVPAKLYSTSATSPTSRSRAARPACSRASPRSASRASPSDSPSGAA